MYISVRNFLETSIPYLVVTFNMVYHVYMKALQSHKRKKKRSTFKLLFSPWFMIFFLLNL